MRCCGDWKTKFPEKLIEVSGADLRRDASGRFYDRFRRRIMFPIANESGKIAGIRRAFAGRRHAEIFKFAGDVDLFQERAAVSPGPREKSPLRRGGFVVLVEGYMDTIAVALAGAEKMLAASCGTSLTEAQVKLVSRFTKRIVVNYDPDNAGQAATERSLALLLEQDFDTRVLALPSLDGKPADPDTYIQKKGAAEYKKLLEKAPPFLDYLIGRARQMDLTTAQGKLSAVNFLMPHVQRIANPLLRSEWATRISQQLRVEEPVLREALRKAAAERRSGSENKTGLIARTRASRRAATGADAD